MVTFDLDHWYNENIDSTTNKSDSLYSPLKTDLKSHKQGIQIANKHLPSFLNATLLFSLSRKKVVEEHK